jgi:hypothetical protein
MAALRRHLTYGNVVSTLALFFVLAGGSAFAAKALRHGVRTQRPNSVNSRKVKDNTLTGADFYDGAGVTGADLVGGSLGSADLANGSVGADQLSQNAVVGDKIADGSVDDSKLAAGSVLNEDIAQNTVEHATVAERSLTGADVADHSLTHVQIREDLLRGIPNAEHLGGNPPAAFLSARFTEIVSPESTGIAIGDGTYVISQSCAPEDILLNGGPIGLRSPTTLVESSFTGRTWTVRVNPRTGGSDPFQVFVLCAVQRGLATK